MIRTVSVRVLCAARADVARERVSSVTRPESRGSRSRR